MSEKGTYTTILTSDSDCIIETKLTPQVGNAFSLQSHQMNGELIFIIALLVLVV